MARKAIHPQELARQLHAWESRRQRRAKAGRTNRGEDEKTAVELLRWAADVLARCVYVKEVRYVDSRRAPLDCADCGGEIDDATFGEALRRKRLFDACCPRCARRRAQTENQPSQAASDPTDGVR